MRELRSRPTCPRCRPPRPGSRPPRCRRRPRRTGARGLKRIDDDEGADRHPESTRAKAVARPSVVDGTPCTATAKACVDIADGEAWLINDGAVTRGPVHVMTGDQDDPTPVGTFHVQWKAEQYTSRQYLVQMPYSVFFADGGVAFHEGRQDTYSGGCVKLGHDDAVAWFNDLQVGDEVQVHSTRRPLLPRVE